MAAAAVIETIAETPEPVPEQEEQNRLLSVWNSLPRKILFYVLFPLGLYIFDVITDLLLAVQYYYSGDSTWFGLTLGFVLGPSIFISVVAHVTAKNDEDSTPISTLKCLLGVLQLGVFPAYLNMLHLLKRGKDVEKHVSGYFPFMHLLEAMLECVPQLCLQLNIILLTDEQVSVLKVIAMVVSLLAAVKAVVTFLYYRFNKSHRTCSCENVIKLIVFTIWKVVELSTRVLAIGLFASAFKQWIALPIGVHWLVMTVISIWADEDHRKWRDIVSAALIMAVETFSILLCELRTFLPQTVLTLLGNITMVTVWYTLKAGQDWYDIPPLVGVIFGSVVSAGIGFFFPVITNFNSDVEDSQAPDPEVSSDDDTVRGNLISAVFVVEMIINQDEEGVI